MFRNRYRFKKAAALAEQCFEHKQKPVPFFNSKKFLYIAGIK